MVVSVNYRLGIFGFLSVPQLKSGTDAQEDSGNFALLDIIKALKFIRRDIAKFGGNPSNVTLMGQSAGAINVYALLTTPEALQQDQHDDNQWLRDAVIEALTADFVEADVTTGMANGRVLAYLNAHAEIFRQEYRDSQVTIRCKLPKYLLHHIEGDGVEVKMVG